MKLNDIECKVLAFLAYQYGEDYGYWGFDGIKRHVKLDHRVIRLACRSLKRKGLTEFQAGLWGDEGPARSGYAATKAGVEFLRQPVPLGKGH